jgi:hypothetical protein
MGQGAGRGTTRKIRSLVRHADAIEQKACAPSLSYISRVLLEPEAQEVSLARARGDDFSRVLHRTIEKRVDFLKAYTAHTDFTPKGWAVTLCPGLPPMKRPANHCITSILKMLKRAWTGDGGPSRIKSPENELSRS